MNKQKILHIVCMVVIAGALIYITESFLMALGILLLIFVFNYVVADKIDDWMRKKERERNG